MLSWAFLCCSCTGLTHAPVSDPTDSLVHYARLGWEAVLGLMSMPSLA